MSATDAALQARLRRMQWLATGLVVAMAALFVATSFFRDRFPIVGFVWAFSEAALIGGLADWFAVTALFRHPLGLPIPHTAIVPRRKDEIGQALARFIAQHFLNRDVIEARLEGANLSARLGDWMQVPKNAASLGRDLAVALDWLVRGAETGAIAASLKPSLRKLVDGIPPEAMFATLIDVLASGNHTQALIDQLVAYGREQLERNREHIRSQIHDKSPWWLPRFVDEEIYDQLVTEIERILRDIGDDPAHEARIRLNERLRALKFALSDNPDLAAKSEALKREILDHPDVNRFLSDLWGHTRRFLEQTLEDPTSDLRTGIERELRALGQTLARETELNRRVDRWLTDLVVYIVERYRDPISRIVSETIAQWDSTATAERIELHIGRDLQFIRINGTLVGGIVGVVLYAVWTALI